ncbi:hypothetical protein BAUCODRAFT_366359 [Baudoinia panamericana UAMH 10762]|uniref:Vacuolar protein sorting-associated protein 51 homolog n=1 Tax=Baudoinia panamericana (strain UAMH 10762) TaxID=717646 RepID=M2NLV6_BAUPA|nr:uncharacterized protein BAUCODRAFT_366359 [Baudoinia panamericana UAMH 10762]EMD00146.1 hypothetical protein BAUCODRAFT_366359 [Baudoinia panamericana UAMH 10762]
MSTIASPRPSISASSRRTSTSTDADTRSSSTSRLPASANNNLRRNRAALRDYYGLKNAAPADARDTPSPVIHEVPPESELDKPGFDADAYVQSLLSREGLEGVLKVEAGLVGEIRSLDGEKKALVYDNYSKLITATDTIRRMREKMDPLTQTSTLVNDIGRIAGTAAQLSADLRRSHGGREGDQNDDVARAPKKKLHQQQTVRWVVGAPQRLEQLVLDGHRNEAERQWKEVSELLDKWQGISGVYEVRQACRSAIDHIAGT